MRSPFPGLTSVDFTGRLVCSILAMFVKVYSTFVLFLALT